MNALWIAMIMGIMAGGSLMLLFRYGGKSGLYVYLAVAIQASNLQVLKQTFVSFWAYPIPAGSVVFASVFLCNDLLQEFYGKQAAVRGIWLGFASQLLFTVFVGLGVMYPPYPDGTDPMHQAMVLLFTPAWRLFVASVVAYLVCQYFNTGLYFVLRRMLKGRYLGARNWITACSSNILDQVFFSFLAWKILAPVPVDGQTLLWTYMMGPFWVRLAVSQTHFLWMYLAKWLYLRMKRPCSTLPTLPPPLIPACGEDASPPPMV